MNDKTAFDTMYDRLLRAERERDALKAHCQILEAALLEQQGVCDVCGAVMSNAKRIAAYAKAQQWPPDWWWHEAHGLHDEAHHQAHRPLDLCVPLNTAQPPATGEGE